MHVIKREKAQAPKPLVPIVERWEVPEHRKLRGNRFNADGEHIGTTGPVKRADPVARENLLRAQQEAAGKPMPPENTGEVDLTHFKPLPSRILLQRPPPVKEENGVMLPEDKWRSPGWFIVLKVGDGVTSCAPGDRVVFNKTHLPKPVRLGRPLHIGRESGVVALIDGEV